MFFFECKPISSSSLLIVYNSVQLTKALMLLIPEETPYISNVLVENNPDTLYEGTCVDDNSKRHRYFVVTVVPEEEPAEPLKAYLMNV